MRSNFTALDLPPELSLGLQITLPWLSFSMKILYMSKTFGSIFPHTFLETTAYYWYLWCLLLAAWNAIIGHLSYLCFSMKYMYQLKSFNASYPNPNTSLFLEPQCPLNSWIFMTKFVTTISSQKPNSWFQ